VIVTEWKEFRNPDFSQIKQKLKANIIFDGRNMYDPATVKNAGVAYRSIGRLSH
jgi:UDPglucose 6-dehydrogenase